MPKVYINGTACISAQDSLNKDAFVSMKALDFSEIYYPVQSPQYKDFISPAMIRRMGNAVKNGMVASKLALQDAGEPELDAIITGTGLGCIKDSEQFLAGIVQNNEEHLTPTSFIQSTHNTVGAQIALALGCKAYNMTYSQATLSMPSALYDAFLQIKVGESKHILVGGIDEFAPVTLKNLGLVGYIKSKAYPLAPSVSEGASFFVLEPEKKEQSYAEISGIKMLSKTENPIAFVHSFLASLDLTLDDIDWLFTNQSQLNWQGKSTLNYKVYSGEFDTDIGFGIWLAAHALKQQRLPEGHDSTELNRILIYTADSRGGHCLILLTKC